MLNKKRGFTLLELTIVMAVTAIMAAGIVTFCVTVKGISDSTKAETGVFNDVASIRAAVSDWISFFDTEDYTLNVGEETVGEDGNVTTLYNRLVAVRKSDSARFVLRVEVGENKNYSLVCPYPFGNEQTDNVEVDENKNYSLVCPYPSGNEQTDNVEVSVPLNGIQMIAFAETVGENFYIDKDGQQVAVDAGARGFTNGRRVFSCTVQSVVNNSRGGIKTVENTFVVATRRETR